MAKESKIRVFPTQYSESAEIGTFQTFRKPSMTEPDNAMSIPEIIARFTRGYGLPVETHPWTSGSASEEGESFEDNESFFEDFMPPKEAPKDAPQESTQQSVQQAAEQAPQEPPTESEG